MAMTIIVTIVITVVVTIAIVIITMMVPSTLIASIASSSYIKGWLRRPSPQLAQRMGPIGRGARLVAVERRVQRLGRIEGH